MVELVAIRDENGELRCEREQLPRTNRRDRIARLERAADVGLISERELGLAIRAIRREGWAVRG